MTSLFLKSTSVVIKLQGVGVLYIAILK